MRKAIVLLLFTIGCFPGPGEVIPGPIGPQGPKGDAGIDANQVTIVQFCPGVTTYSTSFDEVGLCINNHLYAVYSIPGAFLTEIVPGVYSSNGINNSCTFEIKENCLVILK